MLYCLELGAVLLWVLTNIGLCLILPQGGCITPVAFLAVVSGVVYFPLLYLCLIQRLYTNDEWVNNDYSPSMP